MRAVVVAAAQEVAAFLIARAVVRRVQRRAQDARADGWFTGFADGYNWALECSGRPEGPAE